MDDPSSRIDVDTRRKECMMLPGDFYPQFWQDKGGFDVLKFCYDPEYGKGGPGEFSCGTGAWNVKHLFGNNGDHMAALGVPAERMCNGLATHILRLSDVYLVYAEAVIGNNGSTTDASALKAFNAVRSRAIPLPRPRPRSRSTTCGRSAASSLQARATAGMTSCAAATMTCRLA